MLVPLLATPHLVVAHAQRPKGEYTLDVQGDTFLVRKGATKEAVPRVVRDPKRRMEISFRRDRRWAVWDERGLTTRDGDWTSSDRLAAIPVSPKFQGRAEIVAIESKVKAGRRKLAASGLSGARRIGGLVYLLPRWDDPDGTPWFEALVAVDLGQPHPKPRLLGLFGGLSLGRGVVDDRLDVDRGMPTSAINAPGAWGVGTFDPKTRRFGFRPRGVRLLASENDRIVETTSYGTTLVGRQSGGRTVPWLETRGPVEFIPGEGPVLVKCGDRLRNAVTGAELRLAPEAAIRRSNAGVLVFWPEADPRSARLVDASRFEERARWERGTRQEAKGKE